MRTSTCTYEYALYFRITVQLEMAAQATAAAAREVNQVEEDENFGPQPIQRLEVYFLKFLLFL